MENLVEKMLKNNENGFFSVGVCNGGVGVSLRERENAVRLKLLVTKYFNVFSMHFNIADAQNATTKKKLHSICFAIIANNLHK